MWKLFVHLFDGKKVSGPFFIPNPDVSSERQFGRGATPDEHKGFTLMSAALTYLSSKKFIDHMNTKYGDDAEITEVVIKFEDIV